MQIRPIKRTKFFKFQIPTFLLKIFLLLKEKFPTEIKTLYFCVEKLNMGGGSIHRKRLFELNFFNIFDIIVENIIMNFHLIVHKVLQFIRYRFIRFKQNYLPAVDGFSKDVIVSKSVII
jgi:hypothetical protein